LRLGNEGPSKLWPQSQRVVPGGFISPQCGQLLGAVLIEPSSTSPTPPLHRPPRCRLEGRARRAHRRMLRPAHATIASITVATSEALRRASSCRLSAGLEGRNTYRHPSRGIHSCCRIAPHKPVGLNFSQRDAWEMIALLPPLPRQVLSPRIPSERYIR